MSPFSGRRIIWGDPKGRMGVEQNVKIVNHLPLIRKIGSDRNPIYQHFCRDQDPVKEKDADGR